MLLGMMILNLQTPHTEIPQSFQHDSLLRSQGGLQFTGLKNMKEQLEKSFREENPKLGEETEATALGIEMKWEDIDPLFVLRAYQPEELSILEGAGPIIF
jgi:hypothetical protein